jgi:uncharacterized protein (TIGR02147 family)
MHILPLIFNYLDYRSYLKDCCEVLKNNDAGFSFRLFAKLCGSNSPNYLQLILACKLSLQEDALPGLVKAFALKKKEVRYLRELIAFNHAKTFQQRDEQYRKLLKIKTAATHQKIEKGHYSYYSKWYHSAVRAVLGYYKFYPGKSGYSDIGRRLRPCLSGQQVRFSMKLLERLGLIRVGAHGHYEQSSPVITSGPNVRSVEVAKFQMEMMKRAMAALETCPPKQRDISTLTMNISVRGFARMQEKITQLRKELIDIAREDRDDDRVYQLNVQFFPLTRIDEVCLATRARSADWIKLCSMNQKQPDALVSIR